MTVSRYIAFQGHRRLAVGGLREVAAAIRLGIDSTRDGAVLVFDAQTSAPVELDLRGSLDEVLARLPAADASNGDASAAPADDAAARRGPGRPRLGVVAREITLLPRHWDWLAQQPGGASVAIRRLVEDARKANGARDRIRKAQDAAYRFATAIGGNLPLYDDAMRALFAGDGARFAIMTDGWPADIRDHASTLAAPAFAAPR
jgi:hypothetical protein